MADVEFRISQGIIADGAVTGSGGTGVDLSAINQNIIPDANITRDLGSLTNQWRDIYVGPGSFYVNGQKVIQDNAGTIVLSADINQNISIAPLGTGDVELAPVTGVIQAKGTLTIQAGKNITSSDANAISIAVPLAMNAEKITGLATPGVGTDAANKSYVDAALSSVDLSTRVAVAGDSMTGSLAITTSGATTTYGGNLLAFPANGQMSSTGQIGMFLGGNAIIIATPTALTLGSASPAAPTNITVGGTSTLTVNTPTATGHAATKAYVDGEINGTTNATFNNTTVNGVLTSNDITSATVTVSGNAIISGNLTVNGTTTTVNSATMSIGDNIFLLNSGEIGVPSLDAGMSVERGTSANVNFIWDETLDIWSTGTEGLKSASFQGPLTGNADSATVATTLATGRTISLTGDVSGTSAAFDGSGNVSIAAVVANDSHTHTYSNLTGVPATFTPTTENVEDIVGAMVSANSEFGVAVTYDDVSGKLNFNVNDPTITLTGDVTGSAVMSNLGNVSITAVVANDSHTHDSIYPRFNTTETITANWTMRTITPQTTNVYDVGSAALKYANMYATTFNGTATVAQYADLAEKYSSDMDYAPGTVVMFGGAAEITIATPSSTAVAGIVSTDPAYLMNGDLKDGVAVALRGRVPCKVCGDVAKGDLMVAGEAGCAVSDNNANANAVVGRALEAHSGAEGVIEVVVS